MITRLPDEFCCVDMHNHVDAGPDGKLDRAKAQALLDGAARLGIVKIGVSRPLHDEIVSPDEFRRRNDLVIEAMTMSERFIGFCFVDPHFPEDAVAEIERCIVGHGMAGIKLYHQFFICDDAQKPLMDKAAELGVPILMHAGKCTDPATVAAQPRLSHAGHFLEALAKFPDTMLIQAHIGGGGDWEWNLRTLEGVASDNYYIDISGSVIDPGIVRRTIDAVGVDRVLFATDMSLEEGVGKLFAADPTREEFMKICSGNWNRIVSRRRVK